MRAQNLVSQREDAILTSYKLYKESIDKCSDSAFCGHSLSILDEFILREASREEPHVRCTSLDFTIREDDHHPSFQATESTGPAGVEEFLSRLSSAPRAELQSKGPDEASLLIVENLCPETVVKLGQALRIPPHFWSEYVENRSWYWKRRVVPQWLTLPSVQATQSFTKTEWVVPRPFQWKPEERDSEEDVALAELEAILWVKSDSRTSRVDRLAGILRPRIRDGESIASLALVREKLMVWMSRDNYVDGRLVGKPRSKPIP